jgi:hypothetical protein
VSAAKPPRSVSCVVLPVEAGTSTVLGYRVPATSLMWEPLLFDLAWTDCGPHALNPEGDYLKVPLSDGRVYRVRPRLAAGSKFKSAVVVKTLVHPAPWVPTGWCWIALLDKPVRYDLHRPKSKPRRRRKEK